MKAKLKFYLTVSIVVFITMGLYLWGQHAVQKGSGIGIVKQAQCKGRASSNTGIFFCNIINIDQWFSWNNQNM